MGSSSSTRSLTVEQDAETGVVKVSEDLLKRMLGDEADGSQQSSYDEPQQQETERRHYRDEENSYNMRVFNEQWKERLHQTEDEWQQRLNQAEKKHADLLQLSSDQFKSAAEEVEAKFIKHQCVPVCQQLQEDILKCYAANPGKALNCSQIVSAFNKCVDQSRTSILSKKRPEIAS